MSTSIQGRDGGCIVNAGFITLCVAQERQQRKALLLQPARPA